MLTAGYWTLDVPPLVFRRPACRRVRWVENVNGALNHNVHEVGLCGKGLDACAFLEQAPAAPPPEPPSAAAPYSAAAETLRRRKCRRKSGRLTAHFPALQLGSGRFAHSVIKCVSHRGPSANSFARATAYTSTPKSVGHSGAAVAGSCLGPAAIAMSAPPPSGFHFGTQVATAR